MAVIGHRAAIRVQAGWMRCRVRSALTMVAVMSLAAACSSTHAAGPASTTPPAKPATLGSPASATATRTADSRQRAVPTLDHVVVVVLENHSYGEIVGSPDAPFIDSLAKGGAMFTRAFAETHPSEPNYLALFSGATQGVTDDSCPHTFAAANLARTLLDAGRTFRGYSEGLPSPGYVGCGSGAYARKHNPWVNFSNVPAAANQPFTAFPSDYATLPAVSFVIPDLDHDMHDGTVAQADRWLSDHLGTYVPWASSHRSILVLTWDEDDSSADNRIPTIIAGAAVRPGNYDQRIDHYRLLRTLADAYHVAAPGAASTATPITDIWLDH